MLRKLLILIFVVSALKSKGQKYSFHHPRINDGLEINTSGSQVYCLFPVLEDGKNSVFRKVFLNENLQPVDSIDYQLEGKAKLLTSGANQFYQFHIFRTKAEGTTNLDFLITDKSGRILSKIRKSQKDFSTIYNEKLNLNHLRISLVSDQSEDIFFIRISSDINKTYPERIVAIRVKDGSLRWINQTPSLIFVQSTDSLVIVISLEVKLKGFRIEESPYTIHYLNKYSGKEINSVKLFSPRTNHKNIQVFACNGKQIMIVGSKFEIVNLAVYMPNIYMRMYDLKGNLLFENTSSDARITKSLLNTIGYLF
jgi:hypothetical protein